jgi:16S rRNA (adenine1518-N6/adenine1519-N6)-dimethyltransferase
MKLSEIKALLVEHDLRLTKSLGQNFLHDQNQLLRIVALAELSPQDRVLEVGPGLGPLTELLLGKAARVLAIEKDERLVRVLQIRLPVPSLELVRADALEYLRQEPRDWTDWKLVANLPYSVASPILVELAQSEHGPERMVATLQIEVARRLAAQPGSTDYGLLTLLVQLHYEPCGWFKIPASCFFPQPEVDSACVCLKRRPQPLLASELQREFMAVVKCGFSQRRKMISKLLKSKWPCDRVDQALAAIGVSPQARAETLDLGQFVRLTELLAPSSGG